MVLGNSVDPVVPWNEDCLVYVVELVTIEDDDVDEDIDFMLVVRSNAGGLLENVDDVDTWELIIVFKVIEDDEDDNKLDDFVIIELAVLRMLAWLLSAILFLMLVVRCISRSISLWVDIKSGLLRASSVRKTSSKSIGVFAVVAIAPKSGSSSSELRSNALDFVISF